MDLEKLKKEMPYKWRVQSSNQWGANCVAYIDARDVQDLLDDVCGASNWQVKYEEHKGNLFASIGINVDGNWIWKSDCGTESNVEAQKGEASDAFKRAAVMWGVGRFVSWCVRQDRCTGRFDSKITPSDKQSHDTGADGVGRFDRRDGFSK